MTFEEYQKAMEKTPLTEAEKETVQKFQDAIRSVNLRLIRINRDQVGSEIGRYAGSAGFLITEPDRITGETGKKAWQLDADKLDGLHNYMLAEDNFEKIMQVGTDGENAPFGADGKLFFDVLAILPVLEVRVHGDLPDGEALDVTYPFESLRKAQFGYIDPVAYAQELGCVFSKAQ